MNSEYLLKLRAELPSNVKLLAVSKTKPNEDILAAYNLGQRAFGENKPQELRQKHDELPTDIEWHFIGHLQTNKVKYIAPFVSLIHSVDSLEVLQVINKEAAKNNRVINCLLQFHIATELSKFGLTEDEAYAILKSEEFAQLQNVNIVGVMGIGSFTDNKQQTEQEFAHLQSIFNNLKRDFFSTKDDFCELSMGMSGDYQLAIAKGSTIVRIGSSIFGERDYSKK